MKSKIDWFIPGEKFSFHRECLLHYVSRLVECLKSYRNGDMDAGTTLKACKSILAEIDDPEFPFFAAKNFRGLFSFILYELSKVPPRHRMLTLKPEKQYEVGFRRLPIHSDVEKRKHKRIKKPYIVKFRLRPNGTKETVFNDWDVVGVKDLGAGGMLLNCNNKLRIGSLLDLKIGLSTSIPLINCVGIVIRIKKQIHSSIFNIAIAFMEIGRQEKEMINKTAEGILG
ncbi:MAG: PilZ domain-containing protein [Candidatus Scalinduaceae bacterium]